MIADGRDIMIKSIIRYLAITLIVLVGAWATVWYGCDIRRVAAGDRVATFAHDLGVFVQANDGRLPKDWVEFDQWWQAKDGRVRWAAEETGKRMALHSPPYSLSNGITYYVRINDPLVTSMEHHVNMVLDCVLNSMGKTNAANQAMQADGAAAPRRDR